MKKKLGILGGMGPFATAYFYELLTKLTPVKTEQEHLDILISSLSSIPDRTSFLLGESLDNPLPYLIQEGENLIRGGVDILAIPCMTAHHFYPDLTLALSIPILNLPDLLIHFLKEEGYKSPGILATDGVRKSGFLKEQFHLAGFQPIFPKAEENAILMDLIYGQLKKGESGDKKTFLQLSEKLTEKGADCIILGCTELSLLQKNLSFPENVIDPLTILAKAAILSCQNSCP